MLQLRKVLCCLLSFSIVISSTSQIYAQQAVAANQVNCKVSSEADFRFGLETIIKNVMGDSLKTIDYQGIVDKSWAENDVNALIDRLVDDNVKRARKEKSIYELVSTLGSSEAREKLATELAEGVYGSEEFMQVVEAIAGDVGKAISAKLDMITAQAETPVVQCIRKFVGPRYGDTMADLVSQQTRNEITVDPSKSRSRTGVGDIISESAGGITGALLIVLRRAIVQRLSRWVGRRLVGTIVTRAVGAVVSVIGWLLVAKELWDLRLGVLPIIAKEMKSEKTKNEVKSELVKGLNAELSKALDSVPRDVAAGIFQVWSNFKEKNAKVLKLAEKYPEFQDLLKELKSNDEKRTLQLLRKTNDLVSLSLDAGGEEEFLKILRDGTLKKGVFELSETGVKIALETKSIENAFKWRKIAGTNLERVHEIGLHKQADPDSYNTKKLKKLLSLKNQRSIKRFVSLSAQEQQVLFDLPSDQFKDFLRDFSADQLAALSFYVKTLEPDVTRKFVRGIREQPEKMKVFSKTLVRKGVVGSSDKDAAIAYILRKQSVFDIWRLPEDIHLAANGEISPLLLWSKAPGTFTVVAFLALFLLLMIYRMIFGRRQKVIVQVKEK